MGIRNRSCRCGADFETLTELRKHQRDECELREKIGATELDVDELSTTIVDELYECFECERVVDEASVAADFEAETGPQISAEFDCPSCGARNENRAFLDG